MYVPLIGNGDVSVVLPRFRPTRSCEAEIVYNDPLKAPIKQGRPGGDGCG